MSRLLGLDVGSVRIGVAISDPLGITAQPLVVVDRRRGDPVQRIAALVAEREVERVIVGMPYTLAGQRGLAVQAVEAFIATLAENLAVDIETWDERLSTAQAERSMIAGGVRRTKRKERIDKVAAALILQSYMDARSGDP